jgi:hypothetical protein
LDARTRISTARSAALAPVTVSEASPEELAKEIGYLLEVLEAAPEKPTKDEAPRSQWTILLTIFSPDAYHCLCYKRRSRRDPVGMAEGTPLSQSWAWAKRGDSSLQT